MKQIIITQEQFKKAVHKTMHEFVDKARKAKNESGEEYTRSEEFADVLEMSIIFALLEYRLFHKGGKSDESNE